MKVYEVWLETEQPITNGEDFYMYRLFDKKKAAYRAAQVMSTFFPYNEYPTKIILAEYDIDERNSMQNKTILETFHLTDEDGEVV